MKVSPGMKRSLVVLRRSALVAGIVLAAVVGSLMGSLFPAVAVFAESSSVGHVAVT